MALSGRIGTQGIFVEHRYVLSPGKITWNTDPCGTPLATAMWPQCNSTIDRQIESPMPIPHWTLTIALGNNIEKTRSNENTEG